MKILIIDYKPGKEIADIYDAATSLGHEVIIASAEEGTDPRIHQSISIGNRADRALHNAIGYISDSYHLHSTRPTSTLLNRIATLNPDIIHIYDIESHYLNLPLLAFVLTRYKIPTLITLKNPDDIYNNTKALIKRKAHNSDIFTSTFAAWDLLHLAYKDRNAGNHEISALHPGYIIDPGHEPDTYCQIYSAI